MPSRPSCLFRRGTDPLSTSCAASPARGERETRKSFPKVTVMNYTVQLANVDPQPLAVVRRRASQRQLSVVVPEGCGVVWNFLKAAQIQPRGRNAAVYLDDVINLQVGVEVFGPFTSGSEVVPSATPAGTVATTVNYGPYPRLAEAHAAIRRWCADHHHSLAGPNWEIYDHWTDDAAKLRTDVFYLLKANH